MMTPSNYQEGWIEKRARKRLPDVYELHYRKYSADGSYTHEREVLGTVKELPTKKALMDKAAEVRARINAEPRGVFFRDLAARYKAELLPALRPHSQTANKANLRYLETAYNDRRVGDITPGELDLFFNSICSQKTGQPLAKTTRQHIKALAHLLWRQAALWGYLKAEAVNPIEITRVTHGARPKIRGTIVSPEVYRKLLNDKELPLLVKTMIQVAMVTGMRVSEILGLRWEDVDFRNLVIHVRRSVVGKHCDETKNPFSNDDVPLHKNLAKALQAWRKAEPVWGGWVFGSPITERPYHEMTMQQKHLKPAGQRAGVSNLGWHSFRHTHSADLEVAGVSDRIQQASMRHGDPAMTRKYGKHSPALLEKMRDAQNRVVSILEKKKTGTRG